MRRHAVVAEVGGYRNRAWDWSTGLLQAATTADPGEGFSLNSVTYQRLERCARRYKQRTVRIKDGATVINVTSLEVDCFWAWA